MISHAINFHAAHPAVFVNHRDGKGQYPKYTGGPHGTREHRQYLHKRALHFCNFVVGEYVRWKNRRCLITDILDELNLVSWKGLEPKFVEILDNSGQYYYVNPGEIRRSRS